MRPRIWQRRLPIPLLLLLLPTLTLALVPESRAKPGSVQHLAGDASASKAPALPPSAKPEDVGTKDAPVDGLDGKPHAGPFVENPKKAAAVVEDLGASPQLASQKDKAENWVAPEPDSVMEDRGDRGAQRKGPTGTEGGVSEKDKERKEKQMMGDYVVEKKVPPKLPINHQSEEDPIQYAKAKAEKEGGAAEKPKEKPKGAQGLEKPAHLPEKPHDIPHPAPPGVPSADPKSKEPPAKPIKDASSQHLDDDSEEEDGIIRPFHAFFLSLSMIIFSEIGDKTFLVAALMAMRHPRTVVFSAAFSALIAMTVLSALLGHAVPTFLPERLVHFAAAVLFFIFGLKLLREGIKMSAEEGVGEEMKEVEMELEEKEHDLVRRSSRQRTQISAYGLEAGVGAGPGVRVGRRSRSDSRLPAPARSPSSSPSPTRALSPTGHGFRAMLAGLHNLFSLLLSPAWVQTFVMTFLGEWGDRSQIATIAMAAGQDYWWVTLGAVLGHACCTMVAVVGGKAVAGRVSMRTVTLGGAIAFLVFGMIYLAEGFYSAS